MKGEEQILELLAEVLRKQDQSQEQLNRMTKEMQELKADVGELKADVGGLKADVRELKADVGELKATQSVLLENQQGHQQALRILATNQQIMQRELQNIVDILDSVARMQRDTNRRLDRLEHPGDFA